MPESEAAGLLRSGALYPRRLGLQSADGGMVLAGVKRGAFSLYFDDEPIFHFDLEGRWQRLFVAGDHYRKALDLAVDRIGRHREPGGMTLRRRPLGRNERDSLDDEVRAAALGVSERLGLGAYTLVAPPDPAEALGVDELHGLLDRVIAWDAAAWFAERERYLRVYSWRHDDPRALVIPPDAQGAIVLGVAHDGCPLSPDEFSFHCDNVATLLGRRAIQATTAYLAGDSALRRPMPEIAANLEAIAARFPFREGSRPIQPRDLPSDRPSLSGVDVLFEFWAEGPALPDRGGWAELARGRVRRVTASFGRAESRIDNTACIEAAKAAGVAVSVVVPYGFREPGRLEDSFAAVNALPLSAGDFVHLMEHDEPASVRDGGGADALDAAEVERQRAILEGGLAPTRARRAKVTRYDRAKQWI